MLPKQAGVGRWFAYADLLTARTTPSIMGSEAVEIETEYQKGVDMTNWQSVLELDASRRVVAGSERALADAIRRGADLRIYTEFRHNEHIDVTSDNPELVQEVSEFRVTYLLRDDWVAGIMSLRQPVELPAGFGPRPSMSFFMYNQDGQQAIARPFLDGGAVTGEPGPASVESPANMPKYHALDGWDAGTNAPSHNFVYHFESYRFCVSDTWREVLAHDADGNVIAGSLSDLTDAFVAGCEVKVGIRDICADLADDEEMPHELFVQAGPEYYYTERKLFIAGSHPLVRVRPAVPMQYASHGWDFGWAIVRTDGHVVYRRCDPYTLKFEDRESRQAIRWFVR